MHIRKHTPLTLPLFMLGVCLLVGAIFFHTPFVIQAEESTDTTPTTTEKLKERIEKIVEQRKEKIETVLGEVSSPKRAFVGQVSRVSETTLTVDVAGLTRIVPMEPSVELVRNNTKIAAENIVVGDWALVMGLWEDDTFTPKKISFSEASLRPKPQIVALGSLKDVKRASVDFQPRGKDEIITLTINTKTRYQDVNGDAVQLSQFVAEDQVLIVGYKDGEQSYATTVRALASFSREQ